MRIRRRRRLRRKQSPIQATLIATGNRVNASSPLLPMILIQTEDMELYLLLEHILRSEGFTSRLVGGLEEIRILLQAVPSAMVLVECRNSAETFRTMCAGLGQDTAITRVPILALVVQGAAREYVSAIGPEIAEILVRPIWPANLIQAIRGAFRRWRERGASPTDPGAKPMQYADIEMDLASYRVWRGGQAIHLSPTEFKLLRHLLERPEQVVTRQELRVAAWPRNIHVGPKTIDVHVGRLRRALSAGTQTNLIRTIRSVGWALSTASPEEAPSLRSVDELQPRSS
jgi:two-component system, OmpR family, phosphate regulon response regulator PhoB